MMARLSIWPDRAQYRPGNLVTLVAEIVSPLPCSGSVQVKISQNAEVLAELSAPVNLGAAGSVRVLLTWTPPHGPAWGAFGADAVFNASGAASATSAGATVQGTTVATTAFDVAPHWGFAPRYGFFSDFGPEQTPEPDSERADVMLRLHLNCIQFYDWMYSHYDYIPPTEVFTDVLGRTVDFGVVRRKIALCRERGMAPIAYASVYGAEKEFSLAHPDWLLYDGTGQPMSLGGAFFIQDPSPTSGWRQYLLEAYAQALKLGFAGTHCDTYGSPKAGLTHDGRMIRLEEVSPGLMADAQALAVAADPVEGGAMFNNVKAWPLETMSKAPGSALYIEVWSPDDTYRELFEIIMRVRRLDKQQRQPILAAYLHSFFPRHDRPAGAMAGLRLAVAAVFASGGFHLLPGEGQGLLAHPYYPDYGRIGAEDWQLVQAYWDFQTRFGPLLADPEALDVSDANTGADAQEAQFASPGGVGFSSKGHAGTVWTILKQGKGYQTVQLINLTGVERAHWNQPQPEAPLVGGVEVRLERLLSPRAVWWASPDHKNGQPQALTWHLEPFRAGQVLVTTVPSLQYWSMLVVED